MSLKKCLEKLIIKLNNKIIDLKLIKNLKKVKSLKKVVLSNHFLYIIFQNTKNLFLYHKKKKKSQKIKKVNIQQICFNISQKIKI